MTDADEQAWPQPADEPGWAEVIANDRLRPCPPGIVVAAIRALHGRGNDRVVDALAGRISDVLTARLRKLIGTHHPNAGEDMIAEAHARLIRAIVDPASADGPELVSHFYGRVRFRALDAIKQARLHGHRHPTYGLDASDVTVTDPTHPGDDGQGTIRVERMLRSIPDPRKRLAFRLFMEGMRVRQGDPCVATALGVDPKTAAKWIDEAKLVLLANMDVGD